MRERSSKQFRDSPLHSRTSSRAGKISGSSSLPRPTTSKSTQAQMDPDIHSLKSAKLKRTQSKSSAMPMVIPCSTKAEISSQSSTPTVFRCSSRVKLHGAFPDLVWLKRERHVSTETFTLNIHGIGSLGTRVASHEYGHITTDGPGDPHDPTTSVKVAFDRVTCP